VALLIYSNEGALLIVLEQGSHKHESPGEFGVVVAMISDCTKAVKFVTLPVPVPGEA
jgi:hypothetical protein